MKKQVFLLLILLAYLPSFGQSTFVPDDHFEQALIDMGLDNLLDDSVATANIDTLSYLHIPWKDIDDLTGIEDFSSLAFLKVSSNNLSSLDVSQNSQLITLHCDLNELTSLTLGNNTHLKSLFCRANLLTSIDVSGLPALFTLSAENNLITNLDVSHNPQLDYLSVQGNLLWNLNVGSNPALKGLICSETPITALNLSQNPLLSTLYCSTTQLTELDLSQNPDLLFLNCNNNSGLQSLNLKNGNNTSLLTFDAVGNPDLFCIEVDTPAYSQFHWTNTDSWASFQEDCTLGMEESTEKMFSLYPNPAVDQIHFSETLHSLGISDAYGKILETQNGQVDKVSVSSFPAGLYMLHGTTQDGVPVSTRFIRQNP